MEKVAPLTPELRELLARVAAHPHGLGFLHLAELQCVCVTLEVHPRHVMAARRLLETEEGRIQVIEEVRHARARLAEALPPQPSRPRPATTKKPPATAEELIEAARKHPLGVRFLLDAPFETVAVTFRVCPRVVFRARDILRPCVPSSTEEPSRGSEM